MLFKCIAVSVVALKGKASPVQVLNLRASSGGKVSRAEVLELCSRSRTYPGVQIPQRPSTTNLTQRFIARGKRRYRKVAAEGSSVEQNAGFI